MRTIIAILLLSLTTAGLARAYDDDHYWELEQLRQEFRAEMERERYRMLQEMEEREQQERLRRHSEQLERELRERRRLDYERTIRLGQ